MERSEVEEAYTDDIMSEDALTHGVTVCECGDEYKERYYQYLVKQYWDNRINSYTFNSLTNEYLKERKINDS